MTLRIIAFEFIPLSCLDENHLSHVLRIFGRHRYAGIGTAPDGCSRIHCKMWWIVMV